MLAALIHVLGDFELAEDALQDACALALRKWHDMVPDDPVAWLLTAARNSAIDRLRRVRLSLIFTCCHLALAEDARVALTLQAVAGLTAGQIGRMFLVSEPTLAQRHRRAHELATNPADRRFLARRLHDLQES